MAEERKPKYRVGRDAQGLTQRRREVRDRLAKGMNQNEIAADLGLSKQRVTQITAELRALAAAPPEQPKKVEQLWLFLARDEAGDEHLVSVNLAGEEAETLMVAADQERREELEQIAQVLADKSGRTIEMVRFSTRKHAKTMRPVG
jgi:transcriptional regulator with XRE-family HTH domain